MGVSPGGPTPTLHRRMSTPTSQASLPTPYPYPPALESVDEEGASAPQSGADFVPPRADGEGAGPRSGDESTKPGEQQRVPGSEVSPASGRPSPDRADHAEDEAEWQDDPATLEAAALAWGERVASASESREVAAPGAPAPSPPGSPSAADLRQSELAPIATPTAAIELHSRSMAREDIRTAQMATMAEQVLGGRGHIVLSWGPKWLFVVQGRKVLGLCRERPATSASSSLAPITLWDLPVTLCT